MSTKTNPAQLSSAAAASLAPPPGDASPPIGDVFPSPACSSSAAFPSPACPFSPSAAAAAAAAGASGLSDRSGSVASPGRPSCEAPSRSSSESFDLDPAPNRQKPSTLQRRAARHERDSMRRQADQSQRGIGCGVTDVVRGTGRRLVTATAMASESATVRGIGTAIGTGSGGARRRLRIDLQHVCSQSFQLGCCWTNCSAPCCFPKNAEEGGRRTSWSAWSAGARPAAAWCAAPVAHFPECPVHIVAMRTGPVRPPVRRPPRRTSLPW